MTGTLCPPRQQGLHRPTPDSLTDIDPPIIERILPQGTTCQIEVDASLGATCLATQAAVSVATGQPLFGLFRTRVGRVLILDSESEQHLLARRLFRVTAAMDLDLHEVAGKISIQTMLRTNDEALWRINPDDFALVISDTRDRDFQVSDIALMSAGPGGRVACRLRLRAGVDQRTAVLESAPASEIRIRPLLLQFKFPLWLPCTTPSFVPSNPPINSQEICA